MLAQIPLPVRSISAPVAETLTVLGETEISGRTVQFGTLTEAPRLWVALPGATLPIFGYLTALVSGDPILHVTVEKHGSWARRSDSSAEIKAAAMRVWTECLRTCKADGGDGPQDGHTAS
ncbi:hypothetical protein [Glycomyces salinus]|uniref:hypothetical protein n=1 Tax=Glycomyces salinus TaxID=980294 RepID=UPI0018EB9224|nr:hypothetical protein [Glycomyces salinus]